MATAKGHPGGRPGWQRWLRRELPPLLLTIGLLLVARTSFANHYQVPTGSMEPTLLPGDRVVVDMSAYGVRVPYTDLKLLERGEPQRGEVVVFKSPADGTRLIKRVAAVGGDRVSLADGRLTINGVALADPYVADVEIFGQRLARLDMDMGGGPDIPETTIPHGKLLVLGDHRGNSVDGRYFGLVDAPSVYARAVGVYWRRGAGPVWKRL